MIAEGTSMHGHTSPKTVVAVSANVTTTASDIVPLAPVCIAMALLADTVAVNVPPETVILVINVVDQYSLIQNGNKIHTRHPCRNPKSSFR